MSARFVFFVCFGPRSGLRCGGILWSDNSFHVPSLRCVCTRVCLCAFHHCSLGRAQGVQTVAMGGRDPQWPLAQLEESHLPCEGAPSRPGSACCSRQRELLLAEAWRRRKRWQSLTHHWQRPHRHTLHRPGSKSSDFAFESVTERKVIFISHYQKLQARDFFSARSCACSFSYFHISTQF